METLQKRYDIQDVLSQLEKTYHSFDGNLVKMGSQRYKLFHRDGTECVTCGVKGTHFKLQRSKGSKRFHFNLFTDEGVLMTKDHIIPKSKGGLNTLDNYQVMCTHCNTKKGNL